MVYQINLQRLIEVFRLLSNSLLPCFLQTGAIRVRTAVKRAISIHFVNLNLQGAYGFALLFLSENQLLKMSGNLPYAGCISVLNPHVQE